MDKKRDASKAHCTNCRADLAENQYEKRPLGYEVVEGKKVVSTKRFALFCKTCGNFLQLLELSTSGVKITTNPGTSTSAL